MSEQFSLPNRNTAKPVVAGIINIIIGSLCVLFALIIGFGTLMYMPAGRSMFGMPTNLGIMEFLIVLPLALLGILSIMGGIYNLRRRLWGWALAGSIAAAIISTIFGVASIILTAISRDEFA